jgi:hypothetical protein
MALQQVITLFLLELGYETMGSAVGGASTADAIRSSH